MKKCTDLWKTFALRTPRTYLYVCWILIGLAGAVLGFGAELTVLLILVPGYFMNIIWMMRQSK